MEDEKPKLTVGDSTFSIGSSNQQGLSIEQNPSSLTFIYRPTKTPLVAANRSIATEPFPTNFIEVKSKSGFATAKQKGQLVALKVVYGNFVPYQAYGASHLADRVPIQPGCTVYVRGEQYTQVWAKEVFELDGKQFILVPESTIVLVDSNG